MTADLVLGLGPPMVPVDLVQAHQPPGVPHLAVSVQLVDSTGRWLLQQRAHTKSFAGRWANSCCTHPRPGESVTAAGHRRVREELGVETPPLLEAGQFTYRATDPVTGMVEHELDHVLVGQFEGRPECATDPSEVAAVGWLPFDQAALLVAGPQAAPWAWTVLELAQRFWRRPSVVENR